jgi:hypothetical protein
VSLKKIRSCKLTRAVTLFQVFVVVISYFAERRARQIYELKSKLEVQLRYGLSLGVHRLTSF